MSLTNDHVFWPLCVYDIEDYHLVVPVSEASRGSHEASLPLDCLFLQWMRHALEPEKN